MNITILENIFLHLLKTKVLPRNWNIEQIKDFLDYAKLEWAISIISVHQNNMNHILLNNLITKKNDGKKVQKISLMDVQGLSFDEIYEILGPNEKNMQLQVTKLQIWSYILNIFESNRQNLKRLTGMSRKNQPTQTSGKCQRCFAIENQCTCELIGELVSQIMCYVKQIFQDKPSTQQKGWFNIYQQQFNFDKGPLFWDVEAVCTCLSILKLNILEGIFHLNMIDGFVICMLIKLGSQYESKFSHCIVFVTHRPKNIQGSIRITTPTHYTSYMRSTYINQTCLMLYYIFNMLYQTVYHARNLNYDDIQYQVQEFDYFNLFCIKTSSLKSKYVRNQSDRKTQSIDWIASFLADEQTANRNLSVQFDANARQESVFMGNQPETLSTQESQIQGFNQQQPLQSSVLLQQSVLMNQQLQQSVMLQQSVNLQQSVMMQHSVMMLQSVMMQQSVSMQQSVMMDQKQPIQQNKMQQSEFMNDFFLPPQNIQQEVPINQIIKEVSGSKSMIKTKSYLQKEVKIQQIYEQSLKPCCDLFNMTIFNVLRLKSEQFQKILNIGLLGASFGRSQENNHVLQDQGKISSQHAKISFNEDKFYLHDTGSKRGTYINAKCLEIKVGQTYFIADKQAFTIQEIKDNLMTIQTPEIKLVKLKEGDKYIIGRDIKNCNYQFIGYPIHQLLSNKHCIICYVDGKFYIDDLGSKNGTWLRLSEKKQISEPFELHNF
ncbi:hypothetical protein pb186bvf_003816 [Paramecium bursaria]